MSAVMGIAVNHDRVRAVLVRRGRIAWAGEAQREPGSGARAAIESVLEVVPRSRWRRLTVVAAVGPHGAQVKRLEGLPPVDRADTLAAVVRESGTAFFLRNGAPLTTTGVRPAGKGAAWAAAIETPIVDDIRDACRTAGVTLAAVVPGVVVLPLGLTDDSLTWHDGPMAAEIARTGSGLESVRRVPAALAGPATTTLKTVEALTALGEGAARFADAYGAAVMSPREALSVGPGGTALSEPHALVASLRAPLVVMAIAAASFVGSPLAPAWKSARAESSLRTLHASEAWQAMEAAHRELQPVTAALNEIDAFARTASPRSRLLAGITVALPDGVALVGFQVQERTGQLTLLAARPGPVLTALRDVPGFESVELGDQGGAQNGGSPGLQRITVRFRVADAAPIGLSP